jgi:hypothetical protein
MQKQWRGQSPSRGRLVKMLAHLAPSTKHLGKEQTLVNTVTSDARYFSELDGAYQGIGQHADAAIDPRGRQYGCTQGVLAAWGSGRVPACTPRMLVAVRPWNLQ